MFGRTKVIPYICNMKNETTTTTMKTKEIQKLVSKLTDKELMTLVGEMVNQDRLCIPQFYNSNHAEYYGFKSVEQMNKYTDHLYQFIDEMVMDIEP